MSRYSALFSDDASEEKSELTVQPRRAPYQILLVDDEPGVLNALRRVFRQENYTVHTAPGAEEALALLQKTPCHLMISDYMMPGMNGVELLRKVKELHPEMMRIMLTGHADTNAVMGAIKDGAVYKFILKPWNDDDLRVSVALALEQYDLVQKNRDLQKKNKENAREIESLARLTVTNRSQLAIMLHKRNLLNDRQLQDIYKQQQQRKEPILKLILDREWVPESRIREILRKELMIEEVILGEMAIDPAVSALLPRSFCDKQWVLPLRQQNRRLTLVMADPMDMGLIEDLRFSSGLEIHPVMANVKDIRDKIAQVYGDTVTFQDLETVMGGADPTDGIEVVIEDDDDVSLDELLHSTDEPPAIRLANVIILEAIRLKASDIHIHPRTKDVVVRYRIDGVLHDKIHVPHSLHMSLVARIKVMAELDVTERRRPQDGRITVKTPMRIVDLRISSLPTINGEKVVMRMLDRNASVHRLDQLGMSRDSLTRIENVISKPQGIILTTGPTGSGKTTTLYSMLQHNATPEKNYVTIEDPVEYYLDQAGQVMIKEKIGLDFTTVLRAILRQDPDVILLGEIRDNETAEVAFHAALTGHLVFSTLHTNSAVATIARLFDLGLKPYVVASAIEAIVAQRLTRRICPACKTRMTVKPEILRKLGPLFQQGDAEYSYGAGCPKCANSGFQGRVAIYEILLPSEAMRQLMASGASLLEMNRLAREEGHFTLLDDAYLKTRSGLTTPDEILRVLGPQVLD